VDAVFHRRFTPRIAEDIQTGHPRSTLKISL
jgi:hypothetical protein